MANGSNDDRRKRSKPSKPGSVEDWLAQRLAMVGGDDDDDRSDPGLRAPRADDEADEDEADEDEAPTVWARAAEPPPRPSRLRPASEAPVARTIPPSRPGSTPPPAPTAPELDLPDFEAEPLATEDVEPLLTEEVEPIEAPSDTDEVPKSGRGGAPWHEAARAPDEAMWDLLGETTGSTPAVPSGATASVAVGAPAPPPPRASRASQAATIPPASIQVGAARTSPRPAPTSVATPALEPPPSVAYDAEPPVRRTPFPAEADPADEHPDVTVRSPDPFDAVDALIAEASASPRPRRRRTAFSREATPTPAEAGLVAGDTLTPEETEPPSPPSGFDEVFPISRGIPPVRARGAKAVPPPADGAEEPTSALLATDVGRVEDPAPAEVEPGTEWMQPEAGAPASAADEGEDEEDDRTQIRPPSLAETLPRPQEREAGGDAGAEDPARTSGPDDPTRQPFRAVPSAPAPNAPRPLVVQSVRPRRAADDDEPVDDDATQQRAVIAPEAESRRFHGPPRDDDADLAGTLPPEVSSAVITWGSVIVGVLMFFVTMVLFALFIVPYLA